MINYNLFDIDNLSSEMINNIISEIDISEFYQDGKSGFIDWAKVQHFLFDVHPEIVLYYSKEALKKYRWLWSNKGVFNEQCCSFVPSIFIQWNELHNQSKIDLQNPHFIKYLSGLINSYHFAIKFIEKEASIPNSFKRRRARAIIAAGRRKGKTDDEIEKDIQQNSLNVHYLSSLNKDANEDEDVNGSDALCYIPNNQNKAERCLEILVKEYIDYLNKECSSNTDHLFQNYRQAGSQLYPIMTKSSRLYPEKNRYPQQFECEKQSWSFHVRKESICNQEGLLWLLQRTLHEIAKNNPEQAPEQTLYDVHYNANRPKNPNIDATDAFCGNDKNLTVAEHADKICNDLKAAKNELSRVKDSKTAKEAKKDLDNVKKDAFNEFVRTPAFERYFAPISDFDDIMRLFKIRVKGNARTERSRYLLSIYKWLKQNKELLNEGFESEA